MGLWALTDLTASINGLVRRARALGRQSYLPQISRATVPSAPTIDLGEILEAGIGSGTNYPRGRNEPGDAADTPVPADDPRVIESERRQQEQPEFGMEDVSAPSWFDFQRIAYLVLGILFIVIGLTLLAMPKTDDIKDALDVWTKYELGRGARRARKSGALDGGAARIIDNGPNLNPPDRGGGGGDNPDGRNDPRPDFGPPMFEAEVVTADEIRRRGSLAGPDDPNPKVVEDVPPLGRKKQKRVRFPESNAPKPSKKAQDISKAVGETFNEWTKDGENKKPAIASIKDAPIKQKLKPARKEVDNKKVAPPASKAQSRKSMKIDGKSAEHQIFSFPWGNRPKRELPFQVKKD